LAKGTTRQGYAQDWTLGFLVFFVAEKKKSSQAPKKTHEPHIKTAESHLIGPAG